MPDENTIEPKDEQLFDKDSPAVDSTPAPLCVFAECNEQSIGLCRKCGSTYCLHHSSDINPNEFCQNCLNQETINSQSEPLVDTEGVRHSGRHILATGDAFHFASKMIHEMDDAELLQHIEHCRTAIELFGKQLDYQRINLTTAEFEAYERKLGPLKRVGGEIRFSVNNVTRDRLATGMSKDEVKKRLRKKQSVQATAQQVFDALKGKFTPEQLQALLASTGVKKQ